MLPQKLIIAAIAVALWGLLMGGAGVVGPLQSYIAIGLALLVFIRLKCLAKEARQ